MNLLSLIKTNFKNESKFLKYQEFRHTYVYNIFNQYFDITSAALCHNHYRIFYSQYTSFDSFGSIIKRQTNQSFKFNLFNPINAVNLKNKLLSKNDPWDNNLMAQELLPIAIDHQNCYLLLGIGRVNADKIFIENRYNKELINVADNIFHYLSEYEVKPQKSSYNSEFSKLYKNWDEDFWRIKEDGDTSSLIEEKNQEIAQVIEEKDKYYYQLKKLARAEKISGVPLERLSDKYGFSVEDLEKSYF